MLRPGSGGRLSRTRGRRTAGLARASRGGASIVCRPPPQPGRLRRLVGDHPPPRRSGSPFMSGAAILCSGQGYQGADMFNLLADAPGATPVFEAAKSVLDGKDPRQLVREASNNDLHADRVGQILCCTQAMAAWAVLRTKVPRPLLVAGYSVGELAAWGVAGLIDYESVFDLAAQRAAAMDRATKEPSGL